MEFFATHKSIFVVLHAIAAAVGLGSVIVTDTLFFKFLKDFKISRGEDSTLRSISGVVWVVIVLLFVTGLFLFLSGPMDYLAKSKFVAKLVIFCIIVANGFVLNWIITPHLRKIAFGPIIVEMPYRLRLVRRIAFASGAVSIISWFSVFILGSIRSIPVTTWEALLIYILLCAIGIGGSQLYATWIKHGPFWKH